MELRTGQLIHPCDDSLLSVATNFIDFGSGDSSMAINLSGDTSVVDAAERSLLQELAFPGDLETVGKRLRRFEWEDEALRELPAMFRVLSERGLVRKLGEHIIYARNSVAEDAHTTGPGLSCLAVPTKDRPECLTRSLSAWRDAFAGTEIETPDFLIADDSIGQTQNIRCTVEKLFHEVGGKPPSKVYLLNRDSRERLSVELSRNCGRAAGFALGLDGTAGSDAGNFGSVRNFILLSLAGRTLAMADDDIIPDFRVHPACEAGIALSSKPDSTVIRSFRDIHEAGSWNVPDTAETLSQYGNLLGRPLRSILDDIEEIDLGTANSRLIGTAFSNGSRVAALCFGSWGDSGMSSNRYLLSLREMVDHGGSKDFSNEFHTRGMTGRTIFRAPFRTTIGGRNFMGGHIALDARSILPPFSPSGRNEDGLWGHCLNLLHPEACVAYPNQAISHDPPGTRTTSREDAVKCDLWLNELLQVLISLLHSRFESDTSAYKAVGSRLQTLSTGPRINFRRALAESTVRLISTRIGKLEQALDEYGGRPAAWASDVETAISRLVEKLEEPRFWMPREFSHLDEDRAENALADYCGNFGELLAAWPEIFDTAARIGPELLAGARLR